MYVLFVFCSRLRVRCRRKKFTFAISSPDEFLIEISCGILFGQSVSI